MNCHDIETLFAEYWDLPESDIRRQTVDRHIFHCTSCAEQFRFWKESTFLIQENNQAFHLPERRLPLQSNVTDLVMKRIYTDESWRMPITERTYAFSWKTRIKLTAIIACCLTLFAMGFIYAILQKDQAGIYGKAEQISGLVPVANASGGQHTLLHNEEGINKISLASISDPLVLKMPARSVPHYLIALSLLGIICALLIMNWLSRTRI